jgi:hypothetical protein
MLAIPSVSDRLMRWVVYAVLLGLFLTVRGYRSREGDQAYRLPLLLDQKDCRLYAHDPFVRSFDRFNPHRGYLGVLNIASGQVGLSFALAALFFATFMTTCLGVDRLTSAVWTGSVGSVGIVAVALVMLAQAGNIGTNHLFEPILLDRLIAFSLGWCALALAVAEPSKGARGSALLVAFAGWIHPSIGLQLALLLAGSTLAWSCLRVGGRGVFDTGASLVALGLATVPGYLFNVGSAGRLLDGLSAEDFWRLSVELQSPQHMLPHLWRFPQWLAAACYPILALLSVAASRRSRLDEPLSKVLRRLLTVLCVVCVALAVAWFGIEVRHDLRLALFQPFRMATLARGICLVLVSSHWLELWRTGRSVGRLRAVLLAVALTNDWSLVVVTAFEAVMCVGDWLDSSTYLRGATTSLGFGVLLAGIAFLSLHDTEAGHVPLLIAIVVSSAAFQLLEGRDWTLGTGRVARLVALAWLVPGLALIANLFPSDKSSWRTELVRRCRFAALPIDDIERLAVWCHQHTPVDARFVGPPGPKTFRLWSERSLAFNRAASPYDAKGLADWARRFQDHVRFQGSTAAFVEAYLHDRQRLERRYDQLDEADLADLADRQEAQFIIARAPREHREECFTGERLELIHVEGRFAVYRLLSGSPVCDGVRRNRIIPHERENLAADPLR